jgi:hypothetical protein
MNEQYERTPVPQEVKPRGPAPSPKQVNYIERLRDEREITAEHRERLNRALAEGTLTGGQNGTASRTITWLLAQPMLSGPGTDKPVGEAPWPDVPEGRYALLELNGELRNPAADVTRNVPLYGVVTKFYQVDRPTEGRWAGYAFLSAQASDERHPIKNAVHKRRVLDAIADDPAEATKLYGIELGHCGVCGRTLTDETSRAYGIGPVCRERTGW